MSEITPVLAKIKMTLIVWLGHFACFILGGLAIAAYSPFDCWYLLPIIIGTMFFLMKNLSVWQGAIRGGFFGLGLYGAGVSWVYVSIHVYGQSSQDQAMMMTGLFVLALALVFSVPQFAMYRWFCCRSSCDSESSSVLFFASSWVLFEWLRSWLFTGFPWLYVGYAFVDSPLSSWAPVVGVFGLSLLVVVGSASFVQICMHKNDKLQWFVTGLSLVFVIASFGLESLDWTQQKQGKKLDFAAVQGNIPQLIKWDTDYLNTIIATYMRLSEGYWDKDVLLWPENSIPQLYQDMPDLVKQLTMNNTNKTALLFGVPWRDKDKIYGSIVSLGNAEGQYFKQKLVPFGEYVPLQSMLRAIITFFDMPMSSFSSGNSDQQGISINGERIATPICYEVAYPDFVSKMVHGTGMIITFSNDTWFGKSIGPYQHFQIARFRALETGRYLIRVTNDGITALVDPKGRTISRIQRYYEGVLEGTIPIMQGQTPFMRLGSWPILALCFLMLVPVTSKL